jgi:hypothetical protein
MKKTTKVPANTPVTDHPLIGKTVRVVGELPNQTLAFGRVERVVTGKTSGVPMAIVEGRAWYVTRCVEIFSAVLGDRPTFASTPHSMKVLTRLTIKGSYSWSGIGYIGKGDEGRQEQGGPMVAGPWAYGFPLSHVLDNHGGTGAEQARLRADGLLLEVEGGELFEIDGTLYRCIVTKRGRDAWVSFENV